MYDVDVNGTHNVLEAAGVGGHPARARDQLCGGLRRLSRQPGAAHRGRPGPRGARLLLRARQDGVGPHLPAVGRGLARPHDDDRASLHRLRPQRRQLPRALVDEAAVRGRRGQPRRADPVRARGRRGGGGHRAAAGSPRRGVQRGRRRRDDAPRVRRSARARRSARCRLRAYRGLARTMWAARLSEAPPGQIEFALHPWLVSNEKLKQTTGWRPRHTSRETFEITMRAHGKLPPAGPRRRPKAAAAETHRRGLSSARRRQPVPCGPSASEC